MKFLLLDGKYMGEILKRILQLRYKESEITIMANEGEMIKSYDESMTKKEKIDLIIADYNSLLLSGLRTVKKIREMNPKQKIIVTSSATIPFKKNGEFDEILEKPYDQDEVIEIVDEVINEYYLPTERKLLRCIYYGFEEEAKEMLENGIGLNGRFKKMGIIEMIAFIKNNQMMNLIDEFQHVLNEKQKMEWKKVRLKYITGVNLE